MRSRKTLAILLFIFSLSLSILFFIFRDFLAQSLSLGLLGLFIINVVSSVSFFLSPPTFLAIIAAGGIYPPVLVALVSSLGAAVGDGVNFLFGLSGRNLINDKLSKNIWFRIFERYFKKYGGIIIFVISLIPNPFFDAIGILAGAFSYSPRRFFAIIFVGRFIRYFLFAWFGGKV